VARILSLLGSMAFSFYVVYALRRFEMSMLTAGFMTATLTISSTLANAFMGWIGDRLGHRLMLIAGALALTLSALTAWAAPGLNWFYLVFCLAGLANASIWTIGMAMTVAFGSESERPIYIGLSNTLTAPATIISPLLGGLLAETAGFPATFLASAACGLATVLVLFLFVRDPYPRQVERI
jgi:MFS family permease